MHVPCTLTDLRPRRYLFLPVVSNSQFKGLNCLKLAGGSGSYLKADTSVDCDGPEHQRFVFVNMILIICYQSIVAMYIYLLWNARKRINPSEKCDGDRQEALRMRDADKSLDPIRFLFASSRPNRWYHEVVDMYRRIIFMAIIPLTSNNAVTRAYIGAALSMASMIYFRESYPFNVEFTNVLATVSQYQILFVYVAALFVQTGAVTKVGISEFYFGLVLLFANSLILCLAVRCSPLPPTDCFVKATAH